MIGQRRHQRGRSDKTPQVIETGRAVCQDWDNGASFEQEVADLTSVTDWSDYQAGYFIGAATGAFCPRVRVEGQLTSAPR